MLRALNQPRCSKHVPARCFLAALLAICGNATSALAEQLPVASVILRLQDQAEARAQESGIIRQLLVAEGQRVETGDLLAQLDDRQARVATKAAETEVAIAERQASSDVSIRYATKAHQTAAAELARSQESIRRFPKSVSQSQLDVERLTTDQKLLEQEQATHDRKLAELELKLKRAELEAHRLSVQQRTILAPLSGIVVDVTPKLGEWIEPGQRVCRVVNIERLKAEGFVPATDAAQLRIGMPVRLLLMSDESQVYSGRLTFVSPEADPIDHQVRVAAEIENRQQQLRPGLSVKLSIELSEEVVAQDSANLPQKRGS